MDSTVKFNLHSVSDDQGHKVKVWYSIDNRTDGRKCVTIYAKDYGGRLLFLPNAGNNTDIQADYFEKDRAEIFEGHPLYEAALAAAIRKYDIDARGQCFTDADPGI